MNFPWLKYEKWYITTWYTVKPVFCKILPNFSKKTGFWIQKTGYLIKKFICVKTYLGQGKYYLKISAKFVFLDFLKNWIPDPEFFGLKPPCDQDGANKKKFSQISPAVPELLSHRQTDIQRSYYFRVRIIYLSILQSNKGFVCLYVCMSVCLKLNNSKTAGPIWLNFFC